MFTIAACGGGGGSSSGGGGFIPETGGNSENYKLWLELLDPTGNPTNSVSSTQPATLVVLVTRGSKTNPEPDVVVTASADIGLVLPASGTALTNDDGEARFQITQGLTLGAGTITASIKVDDSETLEETITFEVGQAGLRIGYFNGGTFIEGEIGLLSDSLASGGSTELNIGVANEDGDEITTEEQVKVRSNCSVEGRATLTANGGEPADSVIVTTNNSRATVVYTSNGCVGADEVSATLVGNGNKAYATLNIAGGQANSINFVRPEDGDTTAPLNIALRGTGGADRQETAKVTFAVVSASGAPLAGETVKFSLSTEVGGLSLLSYSGISDSEGKVSTHVSAGDVATSVRVVATIEADDGNGNAQDISTVSDLLVVSTGLPDQNSISLSAELLNVGGAANIDGLATLVTVRMADKFNNPVPNGTVAAFTTEYGSIDASCIVGEANGTRAGGTPTVGQCSVQWESQSPRGYDDIGPVAVGRSTIMVTAIGEESFVDANGNGTYDKNELFDNLPEAFLDRNEDGVYSPSFAPGDSTGAEETFLDFNENSFYDLNNTPAWYNGVLCPLEGDDIWCSRDLLHVRDELVIVMSSTIMNISLLGAVGGGTTEGPTYYAQIVDHNGNPPSSTATISVSTSGDCTLLSPNSFEVPNTNLLGAITVPIVTEGDGGVNGPDGKDGAVSVAVTNGGVKVEVAFNCASTPDATPAGDGSSLGLGGT